MRIRDRLGVTPERQERLARAMQLGLFGILAIGLHERHVGIVANAGIGFAITFLPAVLERDYEIPMDAGLTLWITTAVFLHSLGSYGLYGNVPWWDHLTHVLSSSIVAGVGYAATRAVDEHSDDVHLPSRFVFVFILLFVFAFGVLWELVEFALDGIAAATGRDSLVLAQHGLDDTMKDLVFDGIGGVVVAAWGTAHLTDVASALSTHFDGRRDAN